MMIVITDNRFKMVKDPDAIQIHTLSGVFYRYNAEEDQFKVILPDPNEPDEV